MAKRSDKEEVKVLGFWVSPFVLRVQWALKLKGVDYDYVEEDIWGGKSALLLNSNPVYNKVPVLIHNGKPVVESLLILEYIDETWTHPDHRNQILPADPYERAMVRFWAKFAEEKVLHVGYRAMCLSGEEQLNAANSVVESLEFLEGVVRGKKFFGGKNIGYLDIALGWLAYLLEELEEVGSMKIMNANKFPCLANWMKNFVNHPFIKDSLPPRDKMIHYLEERRKVLASE
ncbi:hypothetical protein Sjap_008532 [Stephania japonica]|uniref:glutathione transferase n=1 Tax=Stephania japonica TaxID=461633 RepID=A0AAP0JPN9_9MAGN